MKQKMKIVWLCHFSNPEVRQHLPVRVPFLEVLFRKLLRSPSRENSDFAIWNTNGIREFEKFTNDVELHIIAPYHYLIPQEVRFESRGVHYYFFKDKPSYLTLELRKRVLSKYDYTYKENRRRIKREIEIVKPDLVHIIGAENPYYSSAALDIPSSIPSIVQLQTLISDPKFRDGYFMRPGDYAFRQRIECQILRNASFIGTTADVYVPIIEQINPSARIVPICLALSESIEKRDTKTKYDFVYFASSINKAADLAVEAFSIAHRSHPAITLDIVGGGTTEFMEKLKSRIEELGLSDAIRIEGRLSTHDDVMNQICKSRFALLPLRVDLTSGTIREAMANGLPVLTTYTPSTPSLNKDRDCVLLSKIGDHDALASNMCRLLDDDAFAKELGANSLITASERKTNEAYMQEWVAAYRSILGERK